MKRRNREAEDTGTWMNTYSDLVTLLLTFFVLLYSFSSCGFGKMGGLRKSLRNTR